MESKKINSEFFNKYLNIVDSIEKKKQDQLSKNILAHGLASLMGAKVVNQDEYDSLMSAFKKQAFELSKIKELNEKSEKLNSKLFQTWIRLMKFKSYREKWKGTTKGIETRLKKLQSQEWFFDPDEFSGDLMENLKEAQTCYINNQLMACYIMILRSIEISVEEMYTNHNPPRLGKNGRLQREPMINMLNWARDKKIIRGADFAIAKGFIEARNESVHEVFRPTELQIMSAFETVSLLLKQLQINSQSI